MSLGSECIIRFVESCCPSYSIYGFRACLCSIKKSIKFNLNQTTVLELNTYILGFIISASIWIISLTQLQFQICIQTSSLFAKPQNKIALQAVDWTLIGKLGRIGKMCQQVEFIAFCFLSESAWPNVLSNWCQMKQGQGGKWKIMTKQQVFSSILTFFFIACHVKDSVFWIFQAYSWPRSSLTICLRM